MPQINLITTCNHGRAEWLEHVLMCCGMQVAVSCRPPGSTPKPSISQQALHSFKPDKC